MRSEFIGWLLETMAFGYFSLDANDQIANVNDSWLELFKIASVEDVVDRPIHQFYSETFEAEEFIAELRRSGQIPGRVVLMRRVTEERFFATIYAIALRDSAGTYLGCEGAIINVTDREIQSRISEGLPIGFYIVRNLDGCDRIVYCNKAFAEMLDFETPESAINFDISKLYLDKEAYEEFIEYMRTNDNNQVAGRPVDVRSRKGRIFTVETFIRWKNDRHGQPYERYGFIRDLSKDQALRAIQRDIGLVLHTYSTNLISLRFTIESTIEAFAPNPFDVERSPTNSEKLAALQTPVQKLIASLEEVQKNIRTSENSWEYIRQFKELGSKLIDSKKHEPSICICLQLEIAKMVATVCTDALKGHTIAREPVKYVRECANEVIRVACLSLLHDRSKDILEIESEVGALRAYITTSLRPRREHLDGRVDLWELTNQAVANHMDFARKQGVSFKQENTAAHKDIWGNERDILRAISNVLHNAIKYSWQKPSGAYIRVRLWEQGSLLQLDIENYGLPIPEDERELVFAFGYRSRISTDRGRVGTGIGLTDAKAVIEHYDGKISLESRPAGDDNYPTKGVRPYVTTVSMSLPWWKKDSKSDRDQQN